MKDQPEYELYSIIQFIFWFAFDYGIIPIV